MSSRQAVLRVGRSAKPRQRTLLETLLLPHLVIAHRRGASAEHVFLGRVSNNCTLWQEEQTDYPPEEKTGGGVKAAEAT